MSKLVYTRVTTDCSGDPDVCFYCKIGLINFNPKRGERGTPPMNARTKDHVIPRCYGGLDIAENKVWCCYRCNRDKGSMTLDEFRTLRAYQRTKKILIAVQVVMIRLVPIQIRLYSLL